MSPRRRKLILTAILVAVALVSLDAYRRLHDAEVFTRDALLRRLPGDASAVFFLNFAELRQSRFAMEFYNWIPKTHADAEYSEFLRRTGFDFERDLQQLAVATFGDEKNSSFLVVAEGRFDQKKIQDYAAQSGAREIHGGFEIFSFALSEGRKISLAFLGRGAVALTDASDLSALLTARSSSADSRDWKLRFNRLAGSPIFGVIRQSSAAAAAFATRAPGGFESPQLSALLAQLQWISIAGKPQDSALRMIAEGECTNEQTARQLTDFLNGMLLMAQAGLNGPQTRQQLPTATRDAYLELVKTADVSRIDRGETKSVRVVFDITPKLLEAARLPPEKSAAPAEPPPAKPARRRPGGKK